MAEHSFQEVMKQWRRMCSNLGNDDDALKCEKCPLGEERLCSFEISDIQDAELETSEQKVMAWAEMHPEPVYPTWGEWLLQQGIFRAGTEWNNGFLYQCVNDVIFEPIPADIAQKLGIEPKED